VPAELCLGFVLLKPPPPPLPAAAQAARRRHPARRARLLAPRAEQSLHDRSAAEQTALLYRGPSHLNE